MLLKIYNTLLKFLTWLIIPKLKKFPRVCADGKRTWVDFCKESILTGL